MPVSVDVHMYATLKVERFPRECASFVQEAILEWNLSFEYVWLLNVCIQKLAERVASSSHMRDILAPAIRPVRSALMLTPGSWAGNLLFPPDEREMG
jgi:hypothetical protein